MAWIESHQALKDHPKTRKLARLLDVSVPTAIGHLHCLWWWALDYAPDGDLSALEGVDIAAGALWEGEPEEFMFAMSTAGFIDYPEQNHPVIHDWMEYAGKLVERRKANTERKRQARLTDIPATSHGHPQDVLRTSEATEQYSTEPTVQTVPNQERTPLPSPEAKDSALLVPEWLTTFSEVHQPTPEEIGRLNNWAKDHTLEILVKTAREFVLGWPDYHQQYPKRKPIRSFQGWVRVAENGRNASRSPPPDQSVDPTEKYRQEAAKIAARRGEG